ncbi:MAG: ParA family protein [Gammaproteobacteria bacterium]
MKVVAVHNLKGGVGKTSTAVNLAYLAARDGLRVLLWDLDAQGAASYYFHLAPRKRADIERLLERKKQLPKAIKATAYDRLDLIPADVSYRNFDLELGDLDKPQKRLSKLIRSVEEHYDFVFLDCAPSMSLVAENVFHMADFVLVPLIPTTLSVRAFEQMRRFLKQETKSKARLMPFFSMVDRRKRLHRDLIVEFADAYPDVVRSYIPYASAVERMGEQRAPVNVFADNSPGGQAFKALWQSIKPTFLDSDNARQK